MRKLNYVAISLLSVAALASCGGNETKEFKPALDIETKCSIRVVGEYGNFEALEAEFDRFNNYYPNVTLTYEKLDDYNNSIATVLESDNKPNIFFSLFHTGENVPWRADSSLEKVFCLPFATSRIPE